MMTMVQVLEQEMTRSVAKYREENRLTKQFWDWIQVSHLAFPLQRLFNLEAFFDFDDQAVLFLGLGLERLSFFISSDRSSLRDDVPLLAHSAH